MFWCQSQVIPFPLTDSKQEKRPIRALQVQKFSPNVCGAWTGGWGGGYVCGGCSHNRNHMFSSREQQHGLYERWEFVACCSDIVFRPGSKCPSLARLWCMKLQNLSRVAEQTQTLRWWHGRGFTGHVLTVSDPTWGSLSLHDLHVTQIFTSLPLP